MKHDFLHAILHAGLLMLAAGQSLAAEPRQESRLIAFPPRVELNGSRDRQRLVIQEKSPDGSTRDVTSAAALTVADRAIVPLNEGLLTRLADGATELRVEFAGLTTAVPIEVAGAANAAAYRFRNDVLPILTRAGCNTGRCHGAASGKDGFRLSLFGYDPAGDHYRLTREMAGRRVNVAFPEECLLINKATGRVPHTGGQRIDPEGEPYQTVVAWLEAGASADPSDTPQPVRIEVFPPRAVFAQAGGAQPLVVV